MHVKVGFIRLPVLSLVFGAVSVFHPFFLELDTAIKFQSQH